MTAFISNENVISSLKRKGADRDNPFALILYWIASPFTLDTLASLSTYNTHNRKKLWIHTKETRGEKMTEYEEGIELNLSFSVKAFSSHFWVRDVRIEKNKHTKALHFVVSLSLFLLSLYLL